MWDPSDLLDHRVLWKSTCKLVSLLGQQEEVEMFKYMDQKKDGMVWEIAFPQQEVLFLTVTVK